MIGRKMNIAGHGHDGEVTWQAGFAGAVRGRRRLGPSALDSDRQRR